MKPIRRAVRLGKHNDDASRRTATKISSARQYFALARQAARVAANFFCQGLWSVDLRTPPGPEGSNGSMLCNCRSHPGIFQFLVVSFQFWVTNHRN